MSTSSTSPTPARLGVVAIVFIDPEEETLSVILLLKGVLGLFGLLLFSSLSVECGAFPLELVPGVVDMRAKGSL